MLFGDLLWNNAVNRNTDDESFQDTVEVKCFRTKIISDKIFYAYCLKNSKRDSDDRIYFCVNNTVNYGL